MEKNKELGAKLTMLSTVEILQQKISIFRMKKQCELQNMSLEVEMKGWYHISISKKNLVELEKIGEKLKEIGIEREPRRKKDVSYDRIIQELIQLWKRTKPLWGN